jgi:hypothetical protein
MEVKSSVKSSLTKIRSCERVKKKSKRIAMVKERRNRTRVPVGFELAIAVNDKKVKVKAINISLTGVSCQQNSLFHVNEECDVILGLNQDTVLNFRGKILRVDDGEAIISFLSMDEDSFYHLKRLIQLNSPNPDKVEKELGKPAFSEENNTAGLFLKTHPVEN